MSFQAIRYHDISCGHRVHGHESKCAHLHGHNYRMTFFCEPEKDLDSIGRVIDFSDIKKRLCMWIEEEWDHRFLVWIHDPMKNTLLDLDPDGVWVTAFNPTAENMAQYLVAVVGPRQLEGTGIVLTKCLVEETRKCSASFELETI
jgi:6-pyruvoyltetrahydropterin/6-carboxytetrahydropterin synthase